MITHLRIKEETGHVPATEIVAGVFPPGAKDDNGYSILSSSAIKTFVTIGHSIPSSYVCSFRSSPESSQVKLTTKNEYTRQISDSNKIEPPFIKIICICK